MPVLVGSSAVVAETALQDVRTTVTLGDSGIVLGAGAVDDTGCVWRATGADAWGSKPAPRESAGDRAYDHGQWDATDKYGPRTTPLAGDVRATSHGALHDARARFFGAIGVRSFPLRIVEPGFDGWCLVRQTGEVLWSEVNPTTAKWSINLYAPDPLIYSSQPRTFDLAFPSVTGGRTWPTTWPARYNATVVSGSDLLVNPGTEPAAMQLRITGPADSVTVAFPSTGDALVLSNPDAPQMLRAGEWLDVDTASRRVLLMGQEDASRRAWAGSSDFLQVPERSATKVAIAGKGTTADSRVSGSFLAARL